MGRSLGLVGAVASGLAAAATGQFTKMDKPTMMALLVGSMLLGAAGGRGVTWAAKRRLLNKYAKNLGLREKARGRLFGRKGEAPPRLTIREFRRRGVLTKKEVLVNLDAIDNAIERHEKTMALLKNNLRSGGKW